MFLSCSFPFSEMTFMIPQTGKVAAVRDTMPTPTPRGVIVICSLYERPIVKATRRAALAELFYRKGHSYYAILRQCKSSALVG